MVESKIYAEPRYGAYCLQMDQNCLFFAKIDRNCNWMCFSMCVHSSSCHILENIYENTMGMFLKYGILNINEIIMLLNKLLKF